jgi:hypothetical protein
MYPSFRDVGRITTGPGGLALAARSNLPCCTSRCRSSTRLSRSIPFEPPRAASAKPRTPASTSAPRLSDTACVWIVAALSIAMRRSEAADRAPCWAEEHEGFAAPLLACVLTPHKPHIGLVHKRGGLQGLAGLLLGQFLRCEFAQLVVDERQGTDRLARWQRGCG